MSNKTKRNLIKSLRLTTIIFAILNFIWIILGMSDKSYAASGWDFGEVSSGATEAAVLGGLTLAFGGLPLILITAVKLVIVIIGLVMQTLMSGVYSSLEGKLDFVGLEDIIFAGSTKGSKFLSVNFFDFNVKGTLLVFRQAIAKWYYILRLISAAVLLVILIYIGIRMALSTIAQEQAKYKQMLVDWVTSLALLFLLHYIIIFAIKVNDSLVDAIYKIKMTNTMDVTDTLGNVLTGLVWAVGIEGIFAAVVYLVMVGQIMSFFLLYMKRMITVGFLIMISPLITITYSIDKIGDGKSQALNTWLKELVYNILIQPFHCIIYKAFFDAIGSMMKGNTIGIGAYVFAIVVMMFMKKAEDILRKIFHFEASSMSSISESGQSFANATGKFAKVGMAAGTSLANFKAAGGFKAARSSFKEFRNNMTANSELKREFKQKQESRTLDSGMKFKDYKNTEEGQERLNQIKTKNTAKEMAKTAERNRKTRKGKKVEKVLREEMGDQAYEELREKANNGDENAQKELTSKESEAAKKIPKGKISGFASNVSEKYSKFTQSDYGKLVMAGVHDTTKVASAIAMGGMALGMTGEINDAISMGQLGYGFSSGILENSNGTVIRNTTDLTEKYMSVSDVDSEELNKIFNNIKVNGDAGMYKNMDDVLKKFINEIRVILGDKNAAKELASNIKLSVTDNRKI